MFTSLSAKHAGFNVVNGEAVQFPRTTKLYHMFWALEALLLLWVKPVIAKTSWILHLGRSHFPNGTSANRSKLFHDAELFNAEVAQRGMACDLSHQRPGQKGGDRVRIIK